MGVAVACAFILKRFEANFGHIDDSDQLGFDGTVYEISLVTLSAYLAYLIAEVRPVMWPPLCCSGTA